MIGFRFFIVFVFGLIIAVSCTEKVVHKEYVDRIDSLSLALEEVAVLFESLDTNLLKQQYQITNSNLKKLEQIGNIDDSASVTQYNYVKKSYKMFFKENPFMVEELELTRGQIGHLKHDVLEGLIKKEDLELYFEQEWQAVRVLNYKMSFFYQRINSYKTTFEVLNPKIEMILDSLSQN